MNQKLTQFQRIMMGVTHGMNQPLDPTVILMWLSAALSFISLVLFLHSDISILTHRNNVSNLLYHHTPVSCTPDPSNDGKIIFISCPVEYIESIYVPKEFSSNIYSYDGAFLDTKVEVYQWTAGKGFLIKDWVDYLIKGSYFQNIFFPGITFLKYFPIVSGQGRKFASKVKVGGFTLKSPELTSLSSKKQLDLINDGWYNLETSTCLPVPYVNYTNTRVHGKGLYTGDPSNPKIGDVKITFWGSDVSHISAMGKQTSSVLKEYTLEPIEFMDDKFVLVQEGQMTPSALIYTYLEKYDGSRLYSYISKLTFVASTCYALKINIFGDLNRSIVASLLLFFVVETVVWIAYSFLDGLFYLVFAIASGLGFYYLWKTKPKEQELSSDKIVNLNLYESIPWENSIDTER